MDSGFRRNDGTLTHQPFPLVLSSPSGGGKTTIAKRLLETRTDVGYSISCTTRPPRSGEVDGADYHFWTEEQFRAARERGEFAESAVVHGHLYGTLKREVDAVMAARRHVIMDVDVQGAAQLVRAFPDAVLVFVLPPSADALVARLGGRASEDPEKLRVRLRNALSELLEIDRYDYVVVNEDLATAVAEVASIITAESLRRVRFEGLEERTGQLIAGLERKLDPNNDSNNRN